MKTISLYKPLTTLKGVVPIKKMIKEIDFSTLKNPRRLYQNYIKRFPNFNKPLTETEIIEKYGGISRTLFRDKFLPRMKALSLVTKVKRSLGSERTLNLYGVEWKDMTRAYYFLTPKSSQISVAIGEIIKEFGDYLKGKKEIILVAEKLISLIQKYEVLSKRTVELIKYERKKNGLEEDKTPFFCPIHSHEEIKSKIVHKLLKREDLKDFNFFNVGIRGSKKDSEIKILSRDISKAITNIILIHNDGQPSLPLSETLSLLIFDIGEGLSVLASLINQDVNMSSIMDKKIKDIQVSK